MTSCRQRNSYLLVFVEQAFVTSNICKAVLLNLTTVVSLTQEGGASILLCMPNKPLKLSGNKSGSGCVIRTVHAA